MTFILKRKKVPEVEWLFHLVIFIPPSQPPSSRVSLHHLVTPSVKRRTDSSAAPPGTEDGSRVPDPPLVSGLPAELERFGSGAPGAVWVRRRSWRPAAASVLRRLCGAGSEPQRQVLPGRVRQSLREFLIQEMLRLRTISWMRFRHVKKVSWKL